MTSVWPSRQRAVALGTQLWSMPKDATFERAIALNCLL